MPTLTLTLEPDHAICKHGKDYFLIVKFSDGHIRRYLSLPPKVAKLLEAEGFRLTKRDYFHYDGVKEI